MREREGGRETATVRFGEKTKTATEDLSLNKQFYMQFPQHIFICYKTANGLGGKSQKYAQRKIVLNKYWLAKKEMAVYIEICLSSGTLKCNKFPDKQ